MSAPSLSVYLSIQSYCNKPRERVISCQLSVYAFTLRVSGGDGGVLSFVCPCYAVAFRLLVSLVLWFHDVSRATASSPSALLRVDMSAVFSAGCLTCRSAVVVTSDGVGVVTVASFTYWSLIIRCCFALGSAYLLLVDLALVR